MNRRLAAWGITATSAALAVYTWGSDLGWRFDNLNLYQLFPLLGLLAFSLVWSIYFVSWLGRNLGWTDGLAGYYRLLPMLILVAILLHPGLLVYQLWRDGLGLPPGSYLENYIAPSLKWALILSSIAWLIYLAYELRYKFRGKSWWRLVEYAADAATAGLYVHALAVGRNLQSGWYRYVWYFYGLSLAVCLLDSWRRAAKK